MTIKVIQWTSGGVAREAVRAIRSHAGLELVGMYAWSADKAGRDAGELVGIEPMGVTATADVEALIALKPDIVSYNPLYPDIDQLEALLQAGINISTTCNFLTGWGLDYSPERYGPNARARIQEAALRGGASMFGSGINPGHINYQACVISSLCESVNHLSITEAVLDIVPFLGDPNIAEFGYGEPLDTPGLYARQKTESAVFGDAIELMASLLDIELEEIRCSVDLAPATEDIETPGGLIKAGTIGGVQLRWEGVANGRPVLENKQIWICGKRVSGIESWRGANQHGYHVNIAGNPNVNNVTLSFPQGDLGKLTLADKQALGMRITALPAVNAIPAVCAARPGIVTYKDIAPIAASGRVG